MFFICDPEGDSILYRNFLIKLESAIEGKLPLDVKVVGVVVVHFFMSLLILFVTG